MKPEKISKIRVTVNQLLKIQKKVNDDVYLQVNGSYNYVEDNYFLKVIHILKMS